MKLLLQPPLRALSKAYARQDVALDAMNRFRAAVGRLFSRLDETETEEHQKNIVSAFLRDAFYTEDRFEINTRDRKDLVIHTGPANTDPIGVIIETKRVNAGEMIGALKPNVKALHELILYYFDERERVGNVTVSQLIATDVNNWFLFDENDFRHHFYDNPKLRALYQAKIRQKKDNTFYYAEVARILRQMDDEVPCTWFNLRDAADWLRLPAPEGNARLLPVFKLFSPEHLLKLPFANDANTLNRAFYAELLHLLGLHETEVGGLVLIERLPVGERQAGSLLENTIHVLTVDGGLANLSNPAPYGLTEADRLNAVGLELCLTWLNRILFLKLLEGQLLRYHPHEPNRAFMGPAQVPDFNELHELFFEVLAVPVANRAPGVAERFGPIPYLNSSLFELTELERKVLKIKDLKNRLPLALSPQTVLRSDHGQRLTGALPTLSYLLRFLNAYDFGTDAAADIRPETRTLINASVLGLIFEKINGYKDGSFFTPGFITMFMARDVIRQAALNRFNEQYGWDCPTVTALHNRLDRIDILEANAVVNSLRICDPAVGSGHFLVSALNELIALKHDLGILADATGRRLRDYDISVENDELIVTDPDGLPFQYTFPTTTDRQRVQQTLFHEKQTLIENCLFGADINPNSVNICRLRLWIELLKCSYYAPDLTTLPNLDIQIKTGNSLVSRADTGALLDYDTDGLQQRLGTYQAQVKRYFTEADKTAKQDISRSIDSIQTYFGDQFGRNRNRPIQQKIDKLTKEYTDKYGVTQLFGTTLTARQTTDRDRLRRDIDTLTAEIGAPADDPVFRNPVEWRFAFPDVLDQQGNFRGFDVVIGNPPYIRQELLRDYKPHFRRAWPRTFAGTADLYVYFVELGLSLLRPGGLLTYIVPNKWMRAGYGENLRRYLQTDTDVRQLVDFGDQRVFAEATTYPSILTVQKTAPTGRLRAATVQTLDFGPGRARSTALTNYLAPRWFDVPTAALQPNGWSLTDAATQALLHKIRTAGQPLREYVGEQIFYGIKTGRNEAFVIKADVRARLIEADPRSAEVIKPFLAGRDIKRYQTPVADSYLIFARRGIDIDQYPAILDYLTQFKDQLMPKPKDHKGKWEGRKEGSYKWYEIQDAVDYYPEFGKPHITMPDIALKSQAILDQNGNYSGDTTLIIGVDDKFLLGVLNSTVALYFYASISSTIRGGYLRYKRVYVEQIPIPDAPDAERARVVALVDAVLAAKRLDPLADTSEPETEIDDIVCNLFGLTADERAVVSGRAGADA
jgi:adenine-specific DNA-methyltransferase